MSSSSLNFLKYYKIRVTAKVAPSSISFFFFKKVEFTASSILSPEDPGKVAAEYEGRNVTFLDLQSLVKKINLLYKSKSSVISEAEIPAQDDVSSGVIKILLVERRIGHYHIKGNESTKSNCILPWIHDPEGAAGCEVSGSGSHQIQPYQRCQIASAIATGFVIWYFRCRLDSV